MLKRDRIWSLSGSRIRKPRGSIAPLAAKARDLEALRSAVVDAATVSGPLWISYLGALFYLLLAAGGVTHADMFLERPVKLPFLGVDLPLIGFFWLGPLLFLILHTYVLLHFVILADKIQAFDQELRLQVPNGCACAGNYRPTFLFSYSPGRVTFEWE